MPPFLPVSHQAHAISGLFTFVLVLSAFVFAGVLGAVLFIAWRFHRRRGDSSGEPKQVFGRRAVEIVWTGIPLLIVALLFALTLAAMRASDPAPPAGRTPDIELIAHQWWWEIRYPHAGVVTANDLHLPAGVGQLAELRAADVIHDFWVPRLGRKIDMVPGHPVHLWLEADSAGTYFGACAEFCGAEHAWMRLRVTAQPRAAFEAWLAQQQQPATPVPQSASAAAGAALFQQLTCVSCHTIRGLPASDGVPDTANIGPDLTHLASRPALAAERLANTPATLREWLAHPDVIKPASHMPNLHLGETDLDRLVAYLSALK